MSAEQDARREVSQRLPGFQRIIEEMRDSGDPDRLADAAFIVGLFDAMRVVHDSTLAENERLREALRQVATLQAGFPPDPLWVKIAKEALAAVPEEREQ